MEKETLVTFYICDVSASGFIFGSAATQSAHCSRVAGGSDEVAGRRWGFLLLLESDPGTAVDRSCTGAQKVSVSVCHVAGFPATNQSSYIPFDVP